MGGDTSSCWGDDGIIGIERHVLVMVLTDLAAIGYKLAENSAVIESSA